MKKLFSLALLAATSISLHAGTIRVTAYEPSRLEGTEYANDFRKAKQEQQPLFVSVEKAIRLEQQCRPALIGEQNIATTEDDNFLAVLSSGRVEVQLSGASMLMAPLPPGAEQINLNAESGVVYLVPPSEEHPNGVFVLAYERGGAQD